MRFKMSGGMTARRSTVFRRFFLLTSTVLLVSFILVGSGLMLLVSRNWMNEKLHLLEENTVAVAENTRDVLNSTYSGHLGRNSIIMICNNLRQISNAVDADIFICNPNGEVVYCKEILQSDLAIYTGSCMVHNRFRISADTMARSLTGVCSGTGYLDGSLDDLNFVVSAPVICGDQPVAVVFATQSIHDGLTPYVSSILRMFTVTTLVALVFSFVAIYLLTARMTKPLREMSAAAKQYAKGDFSRRITAKPRLFSGRDEISELVTAFNSMAQALASLEQSRRSFVANVSHELKTPMTTIGGFIDGILDGTIDSDKRSDYLKIVSDEVKRLSRLVTGMLNMSKIESGEAKLNPKEFDISEMMLKTLLSFEQIIDGKKIEVRGVEALEQNALIADPDMINQVVYNLIDNAVKFTPEGGFIEVSSKRDSEKAIIRVSNSGKGIESEEIDKIFERFYKVDKSRSYDTKGAGMGLYIVKTIVELHGGRIKAMSIPNDRTDFIFWLPLS